MRNSSFKIKTLFFKILALLAPQGWKEPIENLYSLERTLLVSPWFHLKIADPVHLETFNSIPCHDYRAKSLLKSVIREFPGSPVVRTQHFHCWGPGSIPSLEAKILEAAWGGQKKKISNYSSPLSHCYLCLFSILFSPVLQNYTRHVTFHFLPSLIFIAVMSTSTRTLIFLPSLMIKYICIY